MEEHSFLSKKDIIIWVPVTRGVKVYSIFVEEYVTSRRNRFRPRSIYIRDILAYIYSWSGWYMRVRPHKVYLSWSASLDDGSDPTKYIYLISITGQVDLALWSGALVSRSSLSVRISAFNFFPSRSCDRIQLPRSFYILYLWIIFMWLYPLYYSV